MIQYDKPYIRYSSGTTFHGNYQLKRDFLSQLNYNLKNTFYHDKKLSHVGCCTWVFDPTDLCEFFGLPEWLCVMYDKIFYYMTLEDAIKFYIKSIEVIRVGLSIADLNSAIHQLAIWRLSDPEYGVYKYYNNHAILDIVELHKKSLSSTITTNTWSAAAGNIEKFASYRNSVFYESTEESTMDYVIGCTVKTCDCHYYVSVAESLIDSVNFAAWCLSEFASSREEAKQLESIHYIRESNQLLKILEHT